MRTIESIQENRELLEQFMELLEKQFGDRCEVVLHDLTRSYDNTIVAIKNGHISGRKVGGSGSNLGLEVLRRAREENEDNQYCYTTKTKDGKILISSSIYFRNRKGEVIGSLCVNYDVSDFMLAENVLHTLTSRGQEKNVKEVLVKDTYELFEYLLSEAQAHVGRPVAKMTREDKLLFIKFLDEHGAFLIKKAGEKVCDYLNISKYFLYNVLNESRNDHEAE